jgi:cyclic pyranopterin phosphate synthase
MDERLEGVVYPFEDIGDELSLLPLAARRALDRAGMRLSIEAYQALNRASRVALAREGAKEVVESEDVQRAIRNAMPPPTRIKPVPDPDPLSPPEQLNHALGPRRAVSPSQWAKLRSLDRYALVHVMRRSIAHNDPGRLDAAADLILKALGKGLSEPPAPRVADQETDELPPIFQRGRWAELDSRPPPSRDRGPDPISSQGRPAPQRRSAPPPRSPDPRFAEPARFAEPPRSPEPRFAEPRSPEPRSAPPHRVGLDAPFDSPSPARPHAGHAISNHLTQSGEIHMVDVGDKAVTHRRATATGIVTMSRETAVRLSKHDTPKGEVLATARVAGVMAAKRTSELIPLCHSIALTRVEILIDVEVATGLVTVSAAVEAHDRTGVEMEALTAVSVTCLTIYDMLKGIDRDLTIGEIRLLTKSGGRTGDYRRRDDR